MFLCLFLFTGCYNTAVAVVDKTTLNNATVNARSLYEMQLLHGEVFLASDEYVIPGGTTIYVTGVTGDNLISMYKRVAKAYSEQSIDLQIKLYEGGTLNSVTTIPTYNKNRNSDLNSTLLIYDENTNPTSIAGAENIPFTTILIGDKQVVVSSTESADYIMRTNTIYVLEITNNAVQSSSLIFSWNWIEGVE